MEQSDYTFQPSIDLNNLANCAQISTSLANLSLKDVNKDKTETQFL